jgi:DNA-directed RNA polymerase subunit RPC12/RpoP
VNPLAIICFFRGHRRGKLVGNDFGSDEGCETAYVKARTFACPRCGRRTKYKVRPKANSPKE